MTDAISQLSSTSTPTVPVSSTPKSTTVDYNAFLQLLVAQLKNQDPTEPTDNAQLMAQLASFSSVEQQVQMNTKLDQLLTSNALGDASNLIGKTISSSEGLPLGKVTAVVLTDNGIQAETDAGNTHALNTGIRITNEN